MDADFTMSITQVFLKGQLEYHLNDDVVAYFCFPTLGVAVPLRPGDYLIFNALREIRSNTLTSEKWSAYITPS